MCTWEKYGKHTREETKSTQFKGAVKRHDAKNSSYCSAYIDKTAQGGLDSTVKTETNYSEKDYPHPYISRSS